MPRGWVIRDLIIVVVVHTYRVRGDEEVIRIISARKATRGERRKYEEISRFRQ